MTRNDAKKITFEKYPHLGLPVADDFRLIEMTFTSTPIVSRVRKIKPKARFVSIELDQELQCFYSANDETPV